MRRIVFVLLLLIFGNQQPSANVPSLEQLEEILLQRQASFFSLSCKFTSRTEILSQLDEFQARNSLLSPTVGELIVERGKYYASKLYEDVEIGSQRVRALKESWNGEERYRSSVPGDPSRSRNSIYPDFSLGTCSANMDLLESLDINIGTILGSRDPRSSLEIAIVDTPLHCLNRIKVTGEEGGETIELKETSYDGKQGYIVMMHYASPRPEVYLIVEHVMDPELDFACVESRHYSVTGGLHKTRKRQYEKDANGNVVLKSCTLVETIRLLALVAEKNEELDPEKNRGLSKTYREEAYDEPGVITHTTFERLEINQPIDPGSYEKENIFVIEGAIWDEGRRVEIQPSLAELEADIERSVVKHMSLIQTEEEQPIIKPESKTTPSVAHAIQDDKEAPDTPAETPLSRLLLLLPVAGLIIIGGYVFWRRGRVSLLIAVSFLLFPGVNPFASETPAPRQMDVVDVGVISFFEDLASCTYSWKNNEEYSLTIEDVTASCGCVSGEHPDVIAPGESGSFDFVIDSSGKVGRFATTIIIKFLEQMTPHKLSLIGYKQSASLTQVVMFSDIIRGEAQLSSDISSYRVITLRIFDNGDVSSLLDDFVYDSCKLEVIESTFNKNDFDVDAEGLTWHFVERAFQVKMRPEGLENGNFSEKILFKHPSFDEIVVAKSPLGGQEEVEQFGLTVNVIGRLLDDFYVKPSALLFLVNREKAYSGLTKQFRLFNLRNLPFEVEYDTSIFALSGNEQKQKYTISVSSQQLDRFLSGSETKMESSVVFRYGTNADLDLPIKIVAY